MRRDSKPLVRNDLLVADGPAGCAANPVRVGHESWYAWLTGQSTFIYEGGTGRFTARLEHRRGIGYWYGYRRRNGKLAKTYLGKSGELTPERLEQAGAFLAGQIPLRRLMSDGHPTGLLAAPSPTDTAAASLGEMTSLPLTKVKPPALPEKLVARARLTQRIDRPVTFVNAPSGFGKTTLLNEWRQGCGMPVAWVALNADDDHPLRFWSTVVTALQTVDPSLGQSWLSQLHSSSPSTLSEIVVNLTNDIIRASDAPNAHHRIGLVLDDYHHIQHPGIHTSLQTWLEHIPPTLKLVVASSTKPPLVLGYLQARGMVVELGADDLRFTLEEGTEFLQQHSPGRHLVYGDMQTLVKRTEGWITGLVLATCVLAQQGKRSSFMEAFTGAHSLLREFFATSVLQRQAPAVQTFLLKTSILRHLTAPLCDAVTGQRGAAGMLARLWEERLFLERLEEANWYRYHDLFRETLCAQLQEQCPAEIPRLHRQAAQWYQAQNAPADAVCHLLAIEAWEEAAVLLESVALRELEHLGEDSRLLHWLQHLPEAVVQQHRALLALYVRLAGIALPSTAVESLLARTELSMAARSPLEKPGTVPETHSQVQRICRPWARSGQEAAELPAGGADDSVWPMLNGMLQCYRDYRRDVIGAETEATAAYQTAQERGHLYTILVAGGGCANLAFSQGHLRRSEQIANQVLRQALELRGRLPEPASIALTALSGVYFMRSQLTQAHQLLVRATEVNPNPTGSNELVTVAVLRAKIQSAQGDNEAAFATIQAVRELHAQRPSSIWLDQDLAAYQALFCLRQRDFAAAERFLSEGGETEENAFSALARAEILIEQDRNVAAEDILNHLLDRYPHGFYSLPMMRARVMLAIALFNQRRAHQARRVMAEAARRAAPEFFIRPFLDYAPQVAPLLSLVLHTANLDAGIQSFLRGTLTKLGQANGAQETTPADEPPALAIAASITPREQEVLRLLSAGLSSREIAARLFISTSTVKTHLENIYRKLGVNSRTQAIAQAHALKLAQL